MTDPAAPRDVVDFQLAVLDAYEKLLASCNWDESRLNEALKSMMSSMLPLLRAQRALGEQLFASHQELVRQYRRTLEASLRQSDGQPGGSS
jgi:DNA-binding transcriptional regulator PaaX